MQPQALNVEHGMMNRPGSGMTVKGAELPCSLRVGAEDDIRRAAKTSLAAYVSLAGRFRLSALDFTYTLMKTLFQFVGMFAVACALASCHCNDHADRAGATVSTPKPYGPPMYGAPFYVSRPTSIGTHTKDSNFYRYGPDGQRVSYRRVPSPQGSYHYIYHDSAQPQPVTPMKETTWRYTSHYPSSWGAPVWVTTYTPKYSPRWVRSSSSPTQSSLATGLRP